MSEAIDPQRAVDFIRDSAKPLAIAIGNRIYVEEYRKTLKALLMKKHSEKSVAAQEVEAYAHPEYQAHLLAIQAAVEAAEMLKWQMIAAQARVEVWRSQEASGRAMDRATR